MSGHSKWSQIKRQKGVADARRGQLFTKLGREISVAARQGGDPDTNFRLRLAIQRARDANMPADNIERAIKRGTGESEESRLTEATYEGYGPGGAAILVQVLTDNRNRTVADVRSTFTRAGGSLGEAGCVAWVFEARGVITLEANGNEEAAEELALAAIDAGAEDVAVEGGQVEVYTPPENLEEVRGKLASAGLPVVSGEVSMVPKSTVSLDDKAGLSTLKLLDKLEEMDDVQRVYSNADFSDALLESYRSEG